jgi:Family of unknown function (DUF6519)
MKGDFSRLTFLPGKHYTAVLQQQGRVQLDADWNEQVDIQAHRTTTETLDVMGSAGAPSHDAGFAIQVVPAGNGQSITIGTGRYYVHGILCENEQPTAIDGQIDLPGFTYPSPPAPPSTSVTYLAYLDVWSRHITVLEDATLQEVALAGPDTTTRRRTVWQVNLLQVDSGTTCTSFGRDWAPPNVQASGRMAAQAVPTQQTTDVCLVPPGAGYRRLENQLYRVEVHDPGSVGDEPAGNPTFVWSRDNGTVAAAVLAIDPATSLVTVSTTGKDSVLGFAPGQWVELSDNYRTLNGVTGFIVQVTAVQSNGLVVDGWPNNTPLTVGPTASPTQLDQGATVRRWDVPGAQAGGAVPIITGSADASGNWIDQWIDLEDGVQVAFAPGHYSTGDYWMIPARSLPGAVEWPLDESGKPHYQDRVGVYHAYAPLALLELAINSQNQTPTWNVLGDCRKLFPPANESSGLFYVGGDGQMAVPDYTTRPNPSLASATSQAGRGSLDSGRPSLIPLQLPLQVGVANGPLGIGGSLIQFSIVAGNGQLFHPGVPSGASITVPTGPDGVASCSWSVDSITPIQRVQATLLDPAPADNPVQTSPSLTVGRTLGIPVFFAARLNLASEVAYDPKHQKGLQGIGTVQEAIDQLSIIEFGEAGIQIIDVRATDPNSNADIQLANNTPIPVTTLNAPIRVRCSEAIDPNTVSRPTCFVTVELPNSQGGTLTGYSALMLAADVSVATGDTATGDATGSWIHWASAAASTQAIIGQLNSVLEAGEAKILARFVLKGNFIWALNNPGLYLDGDSFGVIGDANNPTNLRLPSGDSRRGGDFEMWFWLVSKPVLSTVTFSAQTVRADMPVTGTIILSGPAPQGGAQIVIVADPALSITPSPLIITQGQTSATFTVNVVANITQPREVKIAATYENVGPVTPISPLTADLPLLQSITLAQSTIIGDANVSLQGTILLSAPAPNDIQITLSSDTPGAASVPGSVPISSGQASTGFAVSTAPVAGATPVAITAALGTERRTARLTVTQVGPTALTLSQTAVTGGGTVPQCTVSLNEAAPAGGVQVSLSSSAAAATVPQTVTVQGGNTTSDPFTIATQSVSVDTQVTITATYQSGSLVAALTVQAAVVQAVTFSAAAMMAGDPSDVVTGLVALNGAVPTDTLVTIASANPNVANVQAGTVTVHAGNTQSDPFSITTVPIGASTLVSFTATLNGISATATLSVVAANLTSLVISPSSITGGFTVVGTVTLSDPAVGNGATVDLASSQSVVLSPPSVVVPPGQASLNFAINTQAVSFSIGAIVTASRLAVQQQANLVLVARKRLKEGKEGKEIIKERFLDKFADGFKVNETVIGLTGINSGPAMSRAAEQPGGTGQAFIDSTERPSVVDASLSQPALKPGP